MSQNKICIYYLFLYLYLFCGMSFIFVHPRDDFSGEHFQAVRFSSDSDISYFILITTCQTEILHTENIFTYIL